MVLKAWLAVVLAAGLTACAAEDLLPDLTGSKESGFAVPGHEERLKPAEVIAGADWDAAETRVLTIRQGEFTPAILSFRPRVPYVLRIENRDDTARTLSAGGFFKAIAVKTLSPSEEEIPEGAVLSAIDLEPLQTRELSFVPVEEGYYPFSGPFYSQFLGGPTGAFFID